MRPFDRIDNPSQREFSGFDLNHVLAGWWLVVLGGNSTRFGRFLRVEKLLATAQFCQGELCRFEFGANGIEPGIHGVWLHGFLQHALGELGKALWRALDRLESVTGAASGRRLAPIGLDRLDAVGQPAHRATKLVDPEMRPHGAADGVDRQ